MTMNHPDRSHRSIYIIEWHRNMIKEKQRKNKSLTKQCEPIAILVHYYLLFSVWGLQIAFDRLIMWWFHLWIQLIVDSDKLGWLLVHIVQIGVITIKVLCFGFQSTKCKCSRKRGDNSQWLFTRFIIDFGWVLWFLGFLGIFEVFVILISSRHFMIFSVYFKTFYDF